MLRRLICFWGRLQRSILLASFVSKRSIDTRHSKALLQSEDQRLQRDINLGATSLAFLDRKSTRLNPVTNAQLVYRLMLEKKNTTTKKHNTVYQPYYQQPNVHN